MQKTGQMARAALSTLGLLAAAVATAADWKPVDDPVDLRALFSDTVMQATLAGNERAEATYNADGTGELRAWGKVFTRTWDVRGRDLVCLGMELKTKCFHLEKDADQANRYRATDIITGERVVFTMTRADDKVVVDRKADTESGAPAPEGGAAKPSMDEIAKELSNPNTSVATMTFKTQFRTFEGDLGDADEQSSTTLLFQPGLPFKREDGSKIIWRPALPFIVDQPLFQGGSDWDEESGMGDISMDLAYACPTEKDDPGKLVAVGFFTSLPTGDDDLGFGETTTLGPEVLYGRISKEKIWGLFPSHQWDVGGDVDVNLTSMQLFYFVFAEGGISYGTSPTLVYDHEADEATIPMNFTVSKTIAVGGRPWKVPDPFGPEWRLSFSVAPVVKNPLAEGFK
jgi:hypothetical protein